MKSNKQRIVFYQKQLLCAALIDMVKRGKGSPAYDEAYGRYRKAAKILAHPSLSDRVVKSRIVDRMK